MGTFDNTSLLHLQPIEPFAPSPTSEQKTEETEKLPHAAPAPTLEVKEESIPATATPSNMKLKKVILDDYFLFVGSVVSFSFSLSSIHLSSSLPPHRCCVSSSIHSLFFFSWISRSRRYKEERLAKKKQRGCGHIQKQIQSR